MILSNSRIYLLVALSLLICFAGCHKNKDSPPDPCAGQTPTSARFTSYATFISEDIKADTFYIATGVKTYVKLQLNDSSNIKSCLWHVGSESTYRKGSTILVNFDQPYGPIPVTCIVTKNVNKTCFPSDSGTDTVTQIIQFLPIEKDPVLGYFKGSDNTDPANQYTIHIFIKSPQITIPYFISNFPNGCGSDSMPIDQVEETYNNVHIYSDNGETGCEVTSAEGLVAGDSITIHYKLRASVSQGRINWEERIFRGKRQ